MKELVFLLEEPSAKAMLESLLPRILKEGTNFRCIPFEGKQDLEKQMMRKIRGYQNEQARFIVMRDQDGNPNCRAVKQGLLDKCNESGRGHQCLVRIACRELEAFYLADLQAVERGLGVNGLQRHQNNRKYRDPDNLGSPSRELKDLTKNRYEKISGSREIGNYLNIENTRSSSFRNLVSAVRRLEAEILQDES